MDQQFRKQKQTLSKQDFLQKYQFNKRSSVSNSVTRDSLSIKHNVLKIQDKEATMGINYKSNISQIKKSQQTSQKLTQQQINAIRTLQKIIKWRTTHQAPVDIVGCQKLYDQNQSIQIQKYQILISLVLSVQTKDQTTGKIVERLKKYGLKPEIMSQIQETKLIELIRESNFNKRKAKSIIQISRKIIQSGLPKCMKQLTDLPGIGIKIATLYMRTAQGVNQGIGVDTHVHRISNRLKWVKNTKNPIQTQQKLQQLFPYQYWNEINIALVGFGQILCNAKRPQCLNCPVNKQCPSRLAIRMDLINF